MNLSANSDVIHVSEDRIDFLLTPHSFRPRSPLILLSLTTCTLEDNRLIVLTQNASFYLKQEYKPFHCLLLVLKMDTLDGINTHCYWLLIVYYKGNQTMLPYFYIIDWCLCPYGRQSDNNRQSEEVYCLILGLVQPIINVGFDLKKKHPTTPHWPRQDNIAHNIEISHLNISLVHEFF